MIIIFLNQQPFKLQISHLLLSVSGKLYIITNCKIICHTMIESIGRLGLGFSQQESSGLTVTTNYTTTTGHPILQPTS